MIHGIDFHNLSSRYTNLAMTVRLPIIPAISNALTPLFSIMGIIMRLLKAVAFFCLVGVFATNVSQANVLTGVRLTQHSHDGVGGANPISPFYSSLTTQQGNLLNFNPAGGLSGSAMVGDASTTVSGTITTVGNATFAAGYTDGNMVPTGLTLSYDVSFTIAAQTGSVLAVAGGNSGNGLGIGPTGGGAFNNFVNGDLVTFTNASVANVLLSGTAVQPNIVFSNESVNDLSLYAFRSANFNEAANGATLTDSAGGTVGFGTSSGTIASAVPQNNNFNAASFFPAVSLLNGDVTFEGSDISTGGNFHLKGFGLQGDFSYEFKAIPEPSSLFILIGASLFGLRRKR